MSYQPVKLNIKKSRFFFTKFKGENSQKQITPNEDYYIEQQFLDLELSKYK